MDDAKMKPSAWAYGWPVAILAAGLIGATILGIIGFRDFVAFVVEVDGMAPQTRVVVPGSARVTLPESGPYAVYYETRLMPDEVFYPGNDYLPPVACTLTCESTGHQVAMDREYVPTLRYSLERGTREGILLMSTTVDQPGSYTLNCYSTGSRDRDETVLAFGPNLLWKAGPTLLSVLGRFLASLAVMLGSVAVAILVAVIVAIGRHRSKRLLQAV
jgi:hypothetical protein